MQKLLWGLEFAPAAVDFLDSMHPGKHRAQITKKAKSLINDPHPPGCKKLAGPKNSDPDVWRIRSGDYRILYVIRKNPDRVVIVDIGNRKDVYR